MQPQGRSERGSAERRTEFHAIFVDERRFREWYDVAARRVYAYLFGRCGGEASLAEELTQLTFIDAIRHRETYDGRADSVTWLIAIGRNRLLDHLRRQEEKSAGAFASWCARSLWAMARKRRGTRWRTGTKSYERCASCPRTRRGADPPSRGWPAGPRSCHCDAAQSNRRRVTAQSRPRTFSDGLRGAAPWMTIGFSRACAASPSRSSQRRTSSTVCTRASLMSSGSTASPHRPRFTGWSRRGRPRSQRMRASLWLAAAVLLALALIGGVALVGAVLEDRKPPSVRNGLIAVGRDDGILLLDPTTGRTVTRLETPLPW